MHSTLCGGIISVFKDIAAQSDLVQEVTALDSYFQYKMCIYINYQLLLIINLTLVASE
jgi:hypothetical protein